MRTTLFILSLCLLSNYTVAQNYYVASVQGEVYYQNKLLKKKDKVILKGDLRFKSAASQVKLSGPGGLYTLAANKGRAKGNEFLITLSNELFSTPTFKETARPSFGAPPPNILSYWHFFGRYTFFNHTTLHIDPSMTAKGQTILFLHETNQGLSYQKADIRKDSMLVLPIKSFNSSKGRNFQTTLILQIGDPLVLDNILLWCKTIDEVIQSDNFPPIDYEKPLVDNQILDRLTYKVIHKRAFIKDIRFLIKNCNCNPKSQAELLNLPGFEEYIQETYGNVYKLEQILKEEFGLSDDN